jgi:hypothetical protein
MWKLLDQTFGLLGPRRHRYREPAGPARYLSSCHFEPVTLQNEDDQPEGPLYDLWRSIPGGHKWRHYFRAYEDVIAAFDGRPISMLEIGVFNGSSAQMWSRRLPQ